MIVLILQRFILTFLRIFELLFIVRVIISWIPSAQMSSFGSFIYSITEPVLAPIRAVLHKIPALRDLPLDFSVLVAYLLVDVLRMIILYI